MNQLVHEWLSGLGLLTKDPRPGCSSPRHNQTFSQHEESPQLSVIQNIEITRYGHIENFIK